MITILSEIKDLNTNIPWVICDESFNLCLKVCRVCFFMMVVMISVILLYKVLRSVFLTSVLKNTFFSLRWSTHESIHWMCVSVCVSKYIVLFVASAISIRVNLQVLLPWNLLSQYWVFRIPEKMRFFLSMCEKNVIPLNFRVLFSSESLPDLPTLLSLHKLESRQLKCVYDDFLRSWN